MELTEIKTKRKFSREFVGVSDVRYVYLNEMRRHNKTKKIYPCNPYAEVFQFRDNLFCILTESLDGMGNPWCHLIVGPEKAMLIDTSFGLGDLKGVCDEITGGKELIVVNTHCHFDHAYGNFQFDTVYCHENEYPLIKERMNPHIWDYLFDENGEGIWAEFDKNDIVEFKEYNLIGVKDHHIFDLGGGYEVELIYFPGHSPGHSAFLDKRNHILFGGDQTCYGGPISLKSFDGVVGMRDSLKGMLDRIDEIEAVFPGHAYLDMDPIILNDLYVACNKIIDNPEKPEIERTFTMMDGTAGIQRGVRYDYNTFVMWRV
ncbi:MAG: MBL fold metallo-hydrolase [Lachnospiraceae bacterium]|jgi:glyoxylase-like metal-dependent hydrolase (beta-lactamase superfamily II)